MYCKCKDNTSFPKARLFGLGIIYRCFWYNDAQTKVRVMRTMPWDAPVIIDRDDFLRCFDYWE